MHIIAILRFTWLPSLCISFKGFSYMYHLSDRGGYVVSYACIPCHLHPEKHTQHACYHGSSFDLRKSSTGQMLGDFFPCERLEQLGYGRDAWVSQRLSGSYCASHILVQPNVQRYNFYFLTDQTQIPLDHFNVLDKLWGEISTGFDNRWKNVP